MTPPGQRIYLDHSATTPVDPRVVEAMAPYFTSLFGNSESSHAFGREAAGALEAARQTVADVLGCRLSEVVFVGSGSEADNLALRGVAFADMGTVEQDYEITTWRASIGGGIRLLVDFFGPIPLEFDLAVPLSRDDDDDRQIFSFFFGTTF